MIAREYSIPVFIAATGKASSESSICRRTISGLTAWIAATWPGTSATTQVTAVRP